MLHRHAYKAAILACVLGLSGPSAAVAGLPAAQDLRADTRALDGASIPLLIVYTRPDCAYCERVKREFLIPMHVDPAFAARVRIREVSISAGDRLVDFAGKATTQSAFAAATGMYLVPTVKFFGPDGQEAAEPIVGLLTPDYYYGYLLDAIDSATRHLRATPPPGKKP